MKKIAALILLNLSILSFAFAWNPTGTVKGVVTDAKTGEPIPFVNVIFSEKTIGGATDFDGRYMIRPVEPGEYTIEFSFVGYEKSIQKGRVTAGKILVLNVQLKPEAMEMKAVEITSYKEEGVKTSGTSVRRSRFRKKVAYSMPERSSSRDDELAGETAKPDGLSIKQAEHRAKEMAKAEAIAEDEFASEEGKTTISGSEIRIDIVDKSESIKGDIVEIISAEEDSDAAPEVGMADPSVRVVPTPKADVKKPSEKKPEKLVEDKGQAVPQSGQLTAGRWNDLDNWDFYNRLMQKPDWSRKQRHWGFQFNQRYPVLVEDHGRPVVDALVQLIDQKGKVQWEARTNNNGTAELFAGLFSESTGKYTLLIKQGQLSQRFQQTLYAGNRLNKIDFVRQEKTANNLDVMVVVDATGSMSDELSYLKSELTDVIQKTKTYHSDLDVQVSVNFYRDRGDQYVVRSFPFETDLNVVSKQLSKQIATGGGDYEEAVEAALADAIEKHAWSEDARARLLFLVLDAPPHYTSANLKKLQEISQLAASKGIRIVPVASSGVNKDTEFLLRFLAMATEGEYVFLTDHSGVGGAHMAPTIGPHQVQYLNDLLVDVVDHYVNIEGVPLQSAR